MLIKRPAVIAVALLSVILSVYLVKFKSFEPKQARVFSPTKDFSNNAISRLAWYDLMHRAGNQQVNWKQLEYQNALKKGALNQQVFKSNSHCKSVSVADNQILGTWTERGSRNQAGSVVATTYLPEKDEIWVIGAGGSLWKTPRTEENWQVVNESLRFGSGFHQFISIKNAYRLIAFVNNIPHYSDDFGQTWKPANGIETHIGNSDFKNPILMQDQGIILFLSKPSLDGNITLYKSEDQAKSFVPIISFAETDLNRLELVNPLFSNDLFIVKKSSSSHTELFRIGLEDNRFELKSVNDRFYFHAAPANVVSWKQDSVYHFYAYSTRFSPTEEQFISELYYSDDFGKEWSFRSFLPQPPWEVGLYISPSNPEVIYFGEVECFKSSNNGKSWKVINPWLDYYNNIESNPNTDTALLCYTNRRYSRRKHNQ